MYPTPDEYLRMLKSQVKSFSRVFIVVDALDECLNEPKSNTRDDFLETLGQLPQNVHVLYTSRYNIGTRQKVQADNEIQIVARDDDLSRYLKNYINRRQHLRDFVATGIKKDKSFLDKVLNDIIGRSRGMQVSHQEKLFPVKILLTFSLRFLLAQLHMDFLASKYTLDDFESGIANLPQKLDEVYKIALDRISSQDDFRHNLAISALAWLVCARRPLVLPELKHALAVQVGDRNLVENRFVDEELITSACAGIVIVDEGTNIVRLAHFTAEEYLRENQSTIFKDVQSNMAETCLAYLSLEEFSKVPISKDEVTDRRKRYPFLSYAANHWGDHVSFRVRGRVHRLAWEFLSDPPKVMNAFQVMDNVRFRYETGVTGLHVSAYFGLDKLAKKLMTRGFMINARTQRGETALHWTAFYGQRRFLQVLIDQGAELNIKDDDGRTALHKAIINEDVPSVELLLASTRQIDVNLEDSRGWTGLRWAAAYGQTTVVEMLLRNKVEIDAQDKDGCKNTRSSILCLFPQSFTM
jgi:hypothetical protein